MSVRWRDTFGARMKRRFSVHRAAAAAAPVAALLAALAVPAAPPAADHATAQLALAPGTLTTPISHVVIIYQENHSFDNVFGPYCATHPRLKCSGPTVGDTITLADGVRVTISPEPDVVPLAGHSPTDQQYARQNAWDKVAHCSAADGYACITQVQPDQVRNLYAAAATGTLATNVFQYAGASSWPAHFELISADTAGFDGSNPRHAEGDNPLGGCASTTEARWSDPATPGSAKSYQPTCIPDFTVPPSQFPLGWPSDAGGAYRATPVPHIPNIWQDRLDPAGVSWREYISGAGTTAVQTSAWNICATYAACTYGSGIGNLVASSQLTADALAGRLAAFSIVLPSGPMGRTSQHNGQSMTLGDNQIGAYLQALSTGPQWASTAVFILYDDCGCFYDHVAAPAGMGPRTPFLLVSPWARHGATFTRQTTTASLLRFLEVNFSLRPLNAVDAAAPSLMGMFDFTQTPQTQPLDMHQYPVPAGSQSLPETDPTDPDDNT